MIQYGGRYISGTTTSNRSSSSSSSTCRRINGASHHHLICTVKCRLLGAGGGAANGIITVMRMTLVIIIIVIIIINNNITSHVNSIRHVEQRYRRFVGIMNRNDPNHHPEATIRSAAAVNAFLRSDMVPLNRLLLQRRRRQYHHRYHDIYSDASTTHLVPSLDRKTIPCSSRPWCWRRGVSDSGHHNMSNSRPHTTTTTTTTTVTNSTAPPNPTDHFPDRVPGPKKILQYVPSTMVVQNVSLRYPRTILRQWLSSVPDRDYAVQNISFTLPVTLSSTVSVFPPQLPAPNDNYDNYNNNHTPPSRFLLLTGASSSGKSTLLQLMAAPPGTVPPPNRDGTVTIRTVRNATAFPNDDAENVVVAQPIVLDTISISQYRLPYETRRTISNILQEDIFAVLAMPQNQKVLSSSQNSRSITAMQQQMTLVVEDLIQRVELFPHRDTSNVVDLASTTTPSQLSTTQQYKLAILRACFYSSCSNLHGTDVHGSFVLPGPILLLDECFDQETSTTIQNVQSIFIPLGTQMGALVVVTTHVPERWKPSPQMSVMKLCRGEILSTTSSTHC